MVDVVITLVENSYLVVSCVEVGEAESLTALVLDHLSCLDNFSLNFELLDDFGAL